MRLRHHDDVFVRPQTSERVMFPRHHRRQLIGVTPNQCGSHAKWQCVRSTDNAEKWGIHPQTLKTKLRNHRENRKNFIVHIYILDLLCILSAWIHLDHIFTKHPLGLHRNLIFQEVPPVLVTFCCKETCGCNNPGGEFANIQVPSGDDCTYCSFCWEL